ncbi:MAG: hypothetical protein KC442_18275, partial [Thermomicrobiales bacterium]|nr:hypothetical protein [Thermomicrobiales bacterium]
MDGSRFDRLAGRLAEPGSRRGVFSLLGVSALLAGGLVATDADARHRKRRQRRRKNKGNKGGGNNGGGNNGGGAQLALRATCTPGQSTCASGLRCDSPTTRHSCSSTIAGIDAWCCVPPGGPCTECDCCGDNYCNGDGVCVTNPEG